MSYRSTPYDEIVAVWRGERFRFANPRKGDALIGDATHESEWVTIKCNEQGGEPLAGFTYRFYGRWATYHSKAGWSEKQFHAQTFAQVSPLGQTGVCAYLETAPHVGEYRAKRIWEAYGEQAVETARLHPEEIAGLLTGVNLLKAKQISEYLVKHSRNEATKIALIGLFSGRGFPKQLVDDLIKAVGNTAPERIRKNPYWLLKFAGCGFKRCDALYLALGLPPHRLKRQALCAWHAVESDRSGNTWHPAENVRRALRAAIAGTKVREEKAIELTLRGNLLESRQEEEVIWLADRGKARREAIAADCLCAAMR